MEVQGNRKRGALRRNEGDGNGSTREQETMAGQCEGWHKKEVSFGRESA